MTGVGAGPRPFGAVLIANRGEIAVRVIAACRERGSQHRSLFGGRPAGAARRTGRRGVPIGPAPAAESYLDIPAILDAARRGSAEAVHPGYGFLSENARFARAVLDAGLA